MRDRGHQPGGGAGVAQPSGQAPLPEAGWYADPAGTLGRLRYWDGRAWTDHFETAARSGAPQRQEPPRRLQPLAVLAIAGLVLVSLIELANLLADVAYREVVDGLLNGQPPTLNVIQGTIDRVDDVHDALLAGYLIGAVTFLPWFYRAYANLPRMGLGKLRHSPRWALGAWFVPLLNLVRPKEIADEIYRGSQPAARSGADLATIPSTPLVMWWWGTLLVAGIAARVAAVMVNQANEGAGTSYPELVAALEQEQTGILIDIVASCLAIVAATLAVIFILRVTGAQGKGSEQPVLPVRPPPEPAPAAAVAVGTPLDLQGSSGVERLLVTPERRQPASSSGNQATLMSTRAPANGVPSASSSER